MRKAVRPVSVPESTTTLYETKIINEFESVKLAIIQRLLL